MFADNDASEAMPMLVKDQKSKKISFSQKINVAGRGCGDEIRGDGEAEVNIYCADSFTLVFAVVNLQRPFNFQPSATLSFSTGSANNTWVKG